VIKIHRRVLPGVILGLAGIAIGDDFMADGGLVGVNALQMPDLERSLKCDLSKFDEKNIQAQFFHSNIN
jgi:hypothetical protein